MLLLQSETVFQILESPFTVSILLLGVVVLFVFMRGPRK